MKARSCWSIRAQAITLDGLKYKVVVVGGGASGIVAAISAKRRGASVIICEKLPRPGKKILASGNGRCNLSNDKLDSSFYNPAARPLVGAIFIQFGKDAIGGFFKSIGVKLRSEEGRIFPVTNQSASVMKALEMELKRLSIPVETGFDVLAISGSDGAFTVSSRSNAAISAQSVVIACGGKSYPAFGSDGNGYKLAERLGHAIVEPVPAAVALNIKDPLCHVLQGQKIEATAESLAHGKAVEQAAGEVLFTKYGLSGTAILDISDSVSIAMNRDGAKDVSICVDMVPFMSEAELAGEFAKRAAQNIAPDEMAAGILPNKFGPALRELFSLKAPADSAKALKKRIFRVAGTRGWNEAEFTAGGIDTSEINPASMESKLKKGVYFTGEILDVNGRRGGYNLAWAWASGFVAGKGAADA
jgi:predicted Rossmann fold flavoprotein